jgi:hypothetical protein
MNLEMAQRLLESQTWTFAKTMPTNPHWYTLRRNWASQQDFVDVVLFIREHGVVEKFGSVSVSASK